MKALAFVLLLVSTAAAAPQAEVIKEAKRRFQRANALYQEGRYTDALHLYQAAYDLVPSPDILFNLGLTKEKVFDYEGCSLSFRQYLKESSDAARQSQARDRLEHCRGQTLIPVKVSSLPPSAAVSVGEGADKSPRGRTPARLDLKPGTYRITVETPGYVAQTQGVTVEEGVHPDIDFTLEKLSTLHIEADVSGADVQIDEHPEGATPLQREIKAGLYHVKVAKPGYRTVTRQVRVNAGDQVSLMLSLPVLARERLLAVRLEPPLGADVRIDGRAAGSAPVDLRLSAGAHRLEVAAQDRLSYDGEVQVPEDRDLRLRVRLTKKRTRTQRTVFWTLLGAASAAAAVGLTFGILALEDQSSFDQRPTVALHDQGQLHANLSDGLFAASAGAGVAAAVYYLATWPRKSRADALP